MRGGAQGWLLVVRKQRCAAPVSAATPWPLGIPYGDLERDGGRLHSRDRSGLAMSSANAQDQSPARGLACELELEPSPLGNAGKDERPEASG